MPTGACYTSATYCRHQPYRTWALGLGVTSLLCCSIFTGVPVMIVGYLCMQAANEGRATNKGVSIAGIIMGGISRPSTPSRRPDASGCLGPRRTSPHFAVQAVWGLHGEVPGG